MLSRKAPLGWEPGSWVSWEFSAPLKSPLSPPPQDRPSSLLLMPEMSHLRDLFLWLKTLTLKTTEVRLNVNILTSEGGGGEGSCGNGVAGQRGGSGVKAGRDGGVGVGWLRALETHCARFPGPPPQPPGHSKTETERALEP